MNEKKIEQEVRGVEDFFIAGIILILLIAVGLAIPLVDFSGINPADSHWTSNDTVILNFSIDEGCVGCLENVTFNWNGVNYSLYNDSLVLFLNFDNISAIGENDTYTVDVSSYGNNGTWYGGQDADSGWDCGTAKYGCSKMFDRVGDYADCGDEEILNVTGNMTISVWFKLDGDYTSRQTIVSNLESDGTDASYHLEFGLTNNEFLLYYARSFVSYSSMALADDNWHHLVMVRNGTTGSWDISWYLDGVFDEYDHTTVNVATHVGSTSIGRAGDYAGAGLNFKGNIDQVMVWNRALTAAEINQSYMTNLYKYDVQNWSLWVNQSKYPNVALDDGSYNYFVSATNTSGSENMTNIRTVIVDTTFPDINFTDPNPSDDHTTTNDTVILNFSITESNLDEVIYNWDGTNYTLYNDSLVLLMNFDNISAIGENNTHAVDVSSYSNNGTWYGGQDADSGWDCASGVAGRGCYNTFDGNNDYIDLGTSAIAGNLNDFTISAWVKAEKLTGNEKHIYQEGVPGVVFYLRTDTSSRPQLGIRTGGSFKITDNTEAISTGQWYHLVGTLSSTEGMKIYVNGVEKGSNVNKAAGDESITTAYIGKISVSGYEWNGSIDEFSIWSRSLSAAEVNQSYMSNLYKYDTDKWALYVNQSKYPNVALDEDTYGYFASAEDKAGNLNVTNNRTIIVGSLTCAVAAISSNWTINSSEACVFSNKDLNYGNNYIWFIEDGNLTFKNSNITARDLTRKLGDAGTDTQIYLIDTDFYIKKP